eukprot:SM000160S02552  [mRNA]  locus=s160:263197:265271:+ [translate_table: standard]
MQLVAREFNVSETAFLVRRRGRRPAAAAAGQGQPALMQLDAGGGLKPVRRLVPPPPGNEFDLCWFTPETEVDLCGHATLAAAHLLFSSGIVDGDVVHFHTKSGILTADRITEADDLASSSTAAADEGGGGAGDGSSAPSTSVARRPSGRGVLELDSPADHAQAIAETEWGPVRDALGCEDVAFVGRSSFDLLVELPTADAVLQARPDFVKVKELGGRGVCITARARDGNGHDIVSSFFAPRCGIDEDPVTGSVHCTLATYWAEKLGKDELRAFQASARGGCLMLHYLREAERVKLRGSAVMVMAGVLLNTTAKDVEP